MDVEKPTENGRVMRGLGGKLTKGWTRITRILWATGERRWLTDQINATSHAVRAQKQPLSVPRRELSHPQAKKPERHTSNARSKNAVNSDRGPSLVILGSNREMWLAVATMSSTGILYHHIQLRMTC